jgi:hypothetical protein
MDAACAMSGRVLFSRNDDPAIPTGLCPKPRVAPTWRLPWVGCIETYNSEGIVSGSYFQTRGARSRATPKVRNRFTFTKRALQCGDRYSAVAQPPWTAVARHRFGKRSSLRAKHPISHDSAPRIRAAFLIAMYRLSPSYPTQTTSSNVTNAIHGKLANHVRTFRAKL